ncbi:MAG: hypothetical protein DRJ05_01310 [Bacteroidetes bacterium]|nr:MAG: hypothetical protein DRJ05_01310 [Bacteroidota bacterium]
MINLRIKILVLLIFSILGLLITAYSQTNLHVSGFITDEANGEPVPNHLVVITVDSASYIIDYPYFTDEEGFYDTDTIIAYTQGTLRALTYDCIGEEHAQDTIYSPGNSNFIFDFDICTELMPPDCLNWFFYESDDFFTFDFFGFAEPGPANSYLWNFGDGSNGEGQQITHTFPGDIGAEYIVSLTTVYSVPGTQDSCVAESFELIVTGNGTNCTADFAYEAEPSSATTINFLDLSVGSPTFWFWDFGDGAFSEEQDPVHIYGSEGFYQVCLFIEDTTGLCYDFYCQEIYVGDSAGYIVTVSGYVLDEFDFYPVTDHEVFISIDSNYIFPGYDNIVTTDETGFYYESIMIPLELTQGFVNIGTFDCLEEFINEDLGFYPNNSFLYKDFYICTDSTTYQCEADFDFNEDPTDPFTYHFFDNSSGTIAEYFWEFGDGGFSFEQNPIHSYNSTGDFNVCLTIMSDSVGYFCSDTYCKTVSVEYSLIANFEFSLDTISGNERFFSFTDISIGNPDSYSWDFGDGFTASIQNPTHEFAEAGEYSVCLQVERNFPNGNFHIDNICKTILAPAYYDFGGQAFINGFPLNNPYPNGDTGIAYLYRKYTDAIVPTDTNLFYEFGYYWFPSTREGDYIIKVGLTENSTHYPDYLQSYYENSLYWDEAEVFQLADTGNYYTNVHLRELEGTGSGSGMLSGTVNIEENCSPSFSVDGVVVMLLGENGNLLSFTLTDESGYFSFPNLAAATYKLYAEETGLFTMANIITLDENNMVVSGIELLLNCEGTVGIDNLTYNNIFVSDIFPNPVKDDISINIELDKPLTVTTEVFDITGRIILKQIFSLPAGKNRVNLKVNHLPKGVYVLSLNFPENDAIFLKKFIK